MFFPRLLVPVGNPTFRYVVRRDLDLDPVSRKNSDVVHPDLPRDMRKHLKTIFKFHLELCVRQCINDHTFNLDSFFFGQKYTPLVFNGYS